MKVAYIAHAFSGKPENIKDAERIILHLIKDHPDFTFYSPLHATGFFYFELDYDTGMQHCFEALSRCDELWLCPGWEASRGCNMELAYAKKHNIPAFVLGDTWTLTPY